MQANSVRHAAFMQTLMQNSKPLRATTSQRARVHQSREMQVSPQKNISEQASSSNSLFPQDILELSTNPPKGTGSGGLLGQAESTTWTVSESFARQTENFRQFVEALYQSHFEKWLTAHDLSLATDDPVRSTAQSAIEDGGSFSALAIGTKIIDFAVSITGGDVNSNTFVVSRSRTCFLGRV
jgi:hypothetical protein